jgi:hypothetical protein
MTFTGLGVMVRVMGFYHHFQQYFSYIMVEETRVPGYRTWSE